MQDLSDRISQALIKEEARAERFANNVRLFLLTVLALVAIINASSVSSSANILNFEALGIGFTYGFIVLILIRQTGYHPMMKYITSCLDVVLVVLLLLMYARIEIPSVALKNYVFLVVFPLIALTAFRYDRNLTLISGGLAIALYIGLIFYLSFSDSVAITRGGYARELFSEDVTYIGQLTKILILGGYVILLSYLAQYSRRLFVNLIGDELNLRNQKELRDWEMKIASQVQNKFLPHSYPAVHGLEISGAFQQGRFVGGDYYDFIKLAEDKLFIAVADVSGKGVPAALIMAEVRASTQILATMAIGLEALTHRLNLLLHQSTDKKHFVTFIAAEIDVTQRRITYINAGHPPPFICSENGIRSLAKGTLPLGMYAYLPGLVRHSELFRPGNMFVSYTDGIVERTNSLGEQFGEERLLDHLRTKSHRNIHDFTRELFDKVQTFGDDKEMDDDVTLAVVKFSNG